MVHLMISLLTLPTVLAKYLLLHKKGYFCKKGKARLKEKAALPPHSFTPMLYRVLATH